jgi:hypothetical protein
MSRYVPIRFNDEEAAMLERSFAASGETGLSTHIKRVYFDALRPQTETLVELRAELGRIGAAIDRLPSLDPPGTDPQLLLSIVCGLYVMVRRSVGDSIRAQVDQVLDVNAIESYLRGG